MANENVILEVLHYVKWREEQGLGVIAIDMARNLNIDTETARKRLKELEGKNMLERITVRGRHVYRIPGHQVEEFSNRIPTEKDTQPDLPGKITREQLVKFACSIKPGEPVEYLDHMETNGARKTAYIKKTAVKKIWPYCIQLTNGHSCTFIEMWWWKKNRLPIGIAENETYKRRDL